MNGDPIVSKSLHPRNRIQVLDRGLRVIEALNRRNGLGIADLAERVGLPRPTVSRVLATLEEAGYVYACPADGRFRVTAETRALSRGYRPSPWLVDLAQPIADRLAGQLAWPIMVAQRHGDTVVVEYLTDTKSDLLVERATPGKTVSWTGTALGLTFLSFLPTAEAERLRRSMPEAAGIDSDGWARIDALIQDTKRRGYILFERDGRTAIACPIFANDAILASLGVRIALPRRALGHRLDHFVGAITAAAKRLEGSISAYKAKSG